MANEGPTINDITAKELEVGGRGQCWAWGRHTMAAPLQLHSFHCCVTPFHTALALALLTPQVLLQAASEVDAAVIG